MGHNATRGSGQEVFKLSQVGSGRVGAGGFKSSRAGPVNPDPTRPDPT